MNGLKVVDVSLRLAPLVRCTGSVVETAFSFRAFALARSLCCVVTRRFNAAALANEFDVATFFGAPVRQVLIMAMCRVRRPDCAFKGLNAISSVGTGTVPMLAFGAVLPVTTLA